MQTKKRNVVEELDHIDNIITQANFRREEVIRGLGWKHVCNTPGAIWMWEKQLPDGRTVLVSLSWAEDYEKNKFWEEHPGEVDGIDW